MKAIFAGTFDPFTVGHRDIAERAIKVFGNVTVAVAAGGTARADIATRIKIAEISLGGVRGAEVVPFSGLLTDFVAAQQQKCVLVRGIRSVKDYEYERELDAVYKSLFAVDSVYFMTSPVLMHVSSTVVRELSKLGAPLDGYVVSSAADIISKNYGA